MTIFDRIKEDVKNAMRSREADKLNALRFLQSEIKKKEIDQRPNPLTDDDSMAIIKKLVKQRRESIEQYQAGGRDDLVEAEMRELKLLETYLPAQLSEDVVRKIVAEEIKAADAKSNKDFGRVMKLVQAKTNGQADNRLVSELIKSLLPQ